MSVEAGEVPSQHAGLARGGRQQAGRNIEQRGLAAAGGADDGDELVGADGKIGGGDGRIAPAISEGKFDGHAAEADGFGAGLRRPPIALGRSVVQRALPWLTPRIGSVLA